MAGGVANIWGNLLPAMDEQGSQSYGIGDIQIKHQIKTFATFFRDKHRFRSDFVRKNRLIAGGSSPNVPADVDGDLAACLADSSGSHFVFYKEGGSSITMDLSRMSSSQPAVAVDAMKQYEEIDLGRFAPINHTWNAPYKTDWAIAVGDFRR